MTVTAVVPECMWWDGPTDTDCDRQATHEVTLTSPSGSYGDSYTFACGEHLESVANPGETIVAAHPIDAGWIHPGERFSPPARCDLPAPDGYECTRIPHAEGPCALREVRTPAPMGLLTVPVPTKYRPSKWSTPWILLLGLIGYELWAVATSKAGGPLSHLVWWTYGERYSLRWWLCSSALNGLGLWAAAHFMFEWPEVKELLITVACALGVGLIGWYVTR